MLKTAQSFPPIETWMTMSEGEQDAIIQSIEASRKRRARFLPVLVVLAVGAMIAIVCYYAQLSPM